MWELVEEEKTTEDMKMKKNKKINAMPQEKGFLWLFKIFLIGRMEKKRSIFIKIEYDFEKKIEQAYTYLLENKVQNHSKWFGNKFYDALIEQNSIYLGGQTNLQVVKG